MRFEKFKISYLILPFHITEKKKKVLDSKVESRGQRSRNLYLTSQIYYQI